GDQQNGEHQISFGHRKPPLAAGQVARPPARRPRIFIRLVSQAHKQTDPTGGAGGFPAAISGTVEGP
ncbi:MAG: hypothetical protein RML46_12690, partial [Anaerolineae bacterium]|nr:hypothetical protein [Anaerolineae bacterium]